MKFKGIIAGAFLLLSGNSYAEQHLIDQQLQLCIKNVKNAVQMAYCYDTAQEAWQEEVERLYDLVEQRTAEAGTQALGLLQQEQRLWLNYRDLTLKTLSQQCRSEGCHAQLFQQAYQLERDRYQALWRQLDCKECFEAYAE